MSTMARADPAADRPKPKGWEKDVKRITQVLVQGEDVTSALDTSEGVNWTQAIRAYLAVSEPDVDANAVEVRTARVNSWNRDDTHFQYELFAGRRTGEGDHWSGRNYWADVYFAAENDASS